MSVGVVNTQNPGQPGQAASGPSYPEPTQPVGPGGGAPADPNAGYTPYMPADLGAIFDKYAGQALTPDVLQQIAMDLMAANVGMQMMEADYKTGYLEYLQGQLGLNQQQLAVAQQQLDFQQGPYWNWYVTEYFPAQQQMAQNEVEMSEQRTEQAKYSTEQAHSYSLGAYYQSLMPMYELALKMADSPQGVYAMGDVRANTQRNMNAAGAKMGSPPPARIGYP